MNAKPVERTSVTEEVTLSTFLSCVCEMTFTGQADQINEQKIGTSIFGRKPDYDSGADGIVRTQASRLRQKLDVYFTTEGAGEAIRIVLPRGSYVPRFEPRPAEVSTQPNETHRTLEPQKFVPSPVMPGASEEHDRIRMLPWYVCAALALGLLMVLFLHRGAASETNSRQISSSHPIWSRLFMGSRPTLMVPADSGLVLYSGSSKSSTTLDDYARRNYQASAMSSPNVHQEMRLDGATFRYTSIVDLQIAASLARIAEQRSASLNIRYARDLRPNDLKSVNAILSGAAQANPWVQLFEQHMNFILHNDPKSNVYSVINRLPTKGEPAQWDSAPGDPERRVYGVVAFVPNLTGDGDVLIVEGTSMSGTEAAWDFVADDAKLLPFITKIRGRDGNTPHFEILITTNNMGSSAVETSVIAWRTSK